MENPQFVEIRVALPAGLTVPPALLERAQAAAAAVFTDLVEMTELEELARDLRSRGIPMTAQELWERRHPSAGSPALSPVSSAPLSSAAAAEARAGRVRLSDAQKAEAVEFLRQGETSAQVAARFGCSPATIANLKREAGLTRPRGMAGADEAEDEAPAGEGEVAAPPEA